MNKILQTENRCQDFTNEWSDKYNVMD